MLSLPTKHTGFQGANSLAPSYPASATGMLTGTWGAVVAHRLGWRLLLARPDLSSLMSSLYLLLDLWARSHVWSRVAAILSFQLCH